MAINKQIQFLRNTNKIYTSRTEAVNAIETLVTGASTKGKILDGQPILARYKDADGKVKTVTASVYKASNGSTQVTYYDEHVDEVYVGSGTPPSTTKLAVDVTENMVSIVQNTGPGTRKIIDVMSQKAVTEAIDAASSAAKQSTIDALCDNVYIYASTPNTVALFSGENKRYNVSIPLTLKAGSVYRVGKGSVIHLYMDGKLTGTGSIELNNTQIEAPKKRIFDDTVVIKGLMRCDAVYPEWFGAVGDGVTDDAVAIQKAIYNAGHMPVVLTAEKYLVKSTITLAEPFPNSNINPYFEYAHAKGGVWNDKQTLIVEHDIIGDISLDGPVIRTGSNQNYIKINGALVVRCPKDSAIGIDTAGTKASGDTTSMTDISSSDFGYSSEIEVMSVIKGKDSFSYQNSADATYATTYGLGKGTAIVFCSGAGGSCTVREINGFGVGIHMPFTNGTKVSVNKCGCINDFLINGGARFLGGGVTRNDIRLGTHYLSKEWSWTSGRTDICIIRVNDENHSEGKPVEVGNNTFTIDSDNTGSAYIYNYILYKCCSTNFRGNKLITSCTLLNTGMSPWIPVKIAPATNWSSQNNANLLVNKVGWDYKTLDITKGYNTVVENVIIDSQTHTSTYRYGDTAYDVQNRFLCEKIIITTKNAPEFPSTLSEDSIKVIVPHYSQMSKVHFVSEKPTSTTAQKGHIYVLDAVAKTGGYEKHEVWGIESGTLKQLGYYSYDYLTQSAADRRYAKLNDITQRISASSIDANTFAVDNNGFIMVGDYALAPANGSLIYNDYKLLDSRSIVQATGTSTTSVMSQKAVSDALSKKLSNVYTKSESDAMIATNQNVLTAGNGVAIEDNVISVYNKKFTVWSNPRIDEYVTTFSNYGYNDNGTQKTRGSSTRSWVFKIGNYGHKKVYFLTMYAWMCDGIDDSQNMINPTLLGKSAGNVDIGEEHIGKYIVAMSVSGYADNLGTDYCRCVMFCDEKTQAELDADERMLSDMYAGNLMRYAVATSAISDTPTLEWGNGAYLYNGNKRNILLDIVSRPNIAYECKVVKKLNYLYQGCGRLIEITPLWDTSLVTTMRCAFQMCRSLKYADLSHLNLSSVTDVAYLFYFCIALIESKFPSLPSVTNCQYMFNNCYSLQSVTFPELPSVTNCSSMFASCTSLQSVALPELPSVTNCYSMFSSCSSLQSVTLLSLPSVTSCASMFNKCYSLQSLYLDMPNCDNFAYSFYGCYKLHTIEIVDVRKATELVNSFSFCTSLQNITCVEELPKCKISLNSSSKLTLESITNIITHLPDLSGESSKTLTLHATAKALLTESLIAEATNKNWIIA